MIKVEKDMLGDIILVLTANRTSTVATELPIRTAARKMIDLAKFYGGALDLDHFLSQLKHHFNIQSHQLKNEEEQVDYTITIPGKWSGNTYAELRKTQIINPDE